MLSWFNGSDYGLPSSENYVSKFKALPPHSCATSNAPRYNIYEYEPALKNMFTRKHFNIIPESLLLY